MKVVAHPLVVAVALGLLGPTALADDRRDRDAAPAVREDAPQPVSENFEIRGDFDNSELPETVYLTLD